MSELLARYNDIQQAVAALQAEADEIKNALCEQVETTGTVAGYGWIATMKPGRKATDHEAAVKAAIEYADFNAMHSVAYDLRELRDKHTTTKVFVAWAKVTAAAKIDVEPFTVEGEPVFVVERVK